MKDGVALVPEPLAGRQRRDVVVRGGRRLLASLLFSPALPFLLPPTARFGFPLFRLSPLTLLGFGTGALFLPSLTFLGFVFCTDAIFGFQLDQPLALLKLFFRRLRRFAGRFGIASLFGGGFGLTILLELGRRLSFRLCLICIDSGPSAGGLMQVGKSCCHRPSQGKPHNDQGRSQPCSGRWQQPPALFTDPEPLFQHFDQCVGIVTEAGVAQLDRMTARECTEIRRKMQPPPA